jgi:hypothetical protein
MKRSILIVCALGFAILLGTLVSRGDSPDKVADAGKQPRAERQKPKVAEMPELRTGIEAIEAALARPTPPIEFVETPLKDVVEYLKDTAHVEILLDEPALKDAGVDPEVPITRNLRGIPLADVLDILLDRHGLMWTVHNDVMWITSPTKIESDEFFETRVYNVGDLVVYQDLKGVKFDDYSPLSDTIVDTIANKTWENNGGNGTIHGESLGTAKVLIVAQSYRVHRQIATLLSGIRDAAAGVKTGSGVPYRERAEESRSGRGGGKAPSPARHAAPPSNSSNAPKPKSPSPPPANPAKPVVEDPFGS